MTQLKLLGLKSRSYIIKWLLQPQTQPELAKKCKSQPPKISCSALAGERTAVTSAINHLVSLNDPNKGSGLKKRVLGHKPAARPQMWLELSKNAVNRPKKIFNITFRSGRGPDGCFIDNHTLYFH